MDETATTADEVQIFDVGEALKHGDHLSGRTDMAKSPNSFVAVFRTRPRGGETPFTSIQIPIRSCSFSKAN